MMYRVIGSSRKLGSSPFEDSDMESTNDSFHLETPRNQDTHRFQAIYHFSAHKPVQDGLSPLMIACVTGCCQTVRNLLREGADVNFAWEGCIKDAQLCGRHTALSIAAALSTPEIIEELLAAGAKPDVSNDKLGNTPLGMAALFGNHAVIPALVEEGHEEVHRGNYLGHAPIVLAVTTQNAQVTDRLLRLKANPNQAGGSGGSVLAISCLHYSNIEHIKLLLQAGADPNLVVRSESMRRVSTRYMDNQLDLLFRKPGEACLESTGHALLRAGRPIHFAAMFGHIELVELLCLWHVL
ncbi:ANKRD50 [Symbiodinium sp. KB8]|nr:ANKRD50 [Symbiodinium sp. KB8]